MAKTKTKPDFTGYATKNGIKCTDGRTILKDAFKHQDGQTVPLVWQHLHNEPNNILGHAVLENREDGVYCYGYFNNSPEGQSAKEAVAHGDITYLSIYANQLKEQAKKVMHGAIREVSLVLAGANPEARIENLCMAHGDDFEDDPEEAVIYTGIALSHSDDGDSDPDETVEKVLNTLTPKQKEAVQVLLAHAAGEEDEDDGDGDELKHASGKTGDDRTIADVFDTLNEDQKNVVYYMLAKATEGMDDGSGDGAAKHSNIDNEGDTIMKKNVFDPDTQAPTGHVLSHDDLKAILDGAKKCGSLKESFIAHAATYGFDPIDVLFPDAKAVDGLQIIKRNDDWVAGVLSETNHTPFSRIRTNIANITADEARAKGYVTGNLKKEEVIKLMKRTTTPTTIYKKQKLDRDDMIDITDFDVVVWLRSEMRSMLNEEIARAVLIGDGRSAADEDKINELNVRPIAFDDDTLFVHRAQVESTLTAEEIIDELIKARKYYKGSGVPTFYVSNDLLTDMLLIKDKQGRRMYNTQAELAAVLRVSKIVEIELMNDAKRVSGDDTFDILGLIVNLRDYTIGADRGGEVSMFDDFDIDYNQFKYLIETRISGALTRPKSAIVLERKPAVVPAG